MVVAPQDVERTEVVDRREAVGDLAAVEAVERILDVGSRDLEQHAAQLVVDLFVVGVGGLRREAGKHVAEAEVDEQAGVAERHVERHGDLDVVVADLDGGTADDRAQRCRRRSTASRGISASNSPWICEWAR